MTWKEFKESVEAQGITNEMEIWYIDISFPQKINVGQDQDCGFCISEGY